VSSRTARATQRYPVLKKKKKKKKEGREEGREGGKGTGDMARCLRALTTLPEVLSSILNRVVAENGI
jgi:predicted transposase YdaD